MYQTKIISLSAKQLAKRLREAKDAHAKFEAENGPDADWPEWYAQYIVNAEVTAWMEVRLWEDGGAKP